MKTERRREGYYILIIEYFNNVLISSLKRLPGTESNTGTFIKLKTYALIIYTITDHYCFLRTSFSS